MTDDPETVIDDAAGVDDATGGDDVGLAVGAVIGAPDDPDAYAADDPEVCVVADPDVDVVEGRDVDVVEDPDVCVVEDPEVDVAVDPDFGVAEESGAVADDPEADVAEAGGSSPALRCAVGSFDGVAVSEPVGPTGVVLVGSVAGAVATPAAPGVGAGADPATTGPDGAVGVAPVDAFGLDEVAVVLLTAPVAGLAASSSPAAASHCWHLAACAATCTSACECWWPRAAADRAGTGSRSRPRIAAPETCSAGREVPRPAGRPEADVTDTAGRPGAAADG
ncbi:MAG: hypothetical protein ACRDNS_01755 [Trebonia sp.]